MLGKRRGKRAISSPSSRIPSCSFIRTCKKDKLRCVDNACAVSVMTLTPALPQGPAGRVGEGSEDEVEAASRRPLVTTVHQLLSLWALLQRECE